MHKHTIYAIIVQIFSFKKSGKLQNHFKTLFRHTVLIFLEILFILRIIINENVSKWPSLKVTVTGLKRPLS